MKLTNKQIIQFNKDGFLLIKNFADNVICEDILEKAKYHLENKIEPLESETQFLQTSEEKTTVRRLRQVYNREEIFKNWMTNDEIKPILQQLLNKEPVLVLAHHNSIMTKMPSDSSRTPWHQDSRYWSYENSNLISVWLSLDDEIIENGLLEFIPGSHKINYQKEQFDKNSNFIDKNIQNKELIKTAVHSNLKKGDIVLFHCNTLHHANKNNTNKAKISFVYTVKACDNESIKDTRSDFTEIKL